MKRLLIATLIALPFAVLAEQTFVTISSQGWGLIVDTPPLTSTQSTSKDGRFRYIGADTNSGITFSIHTEDMEKEVNSKCLDKYWAKTRTNTNIIMDSMEFFETDMLHGVTYRIEGEYLGQPYKTANSHGYFVKNGKCVDLHVSIIPFSEEGRKNVEKIVRTAKIIQ